MKLRVSHYDCKGIPDAKFESGNSTRFGDTQEEIGSFQSL